MYVLLSLRYALRRTNTLLLKIIIIFMMEGRKQGVAVMIAGACTLKSTESSGCNERRLR